MAKNAIAKVDLTGLDKAEVGKLDVLAIYICKEKSQINRSVLVIGKHLAEVKEILGTGGKGSQFGPWVVSNCAFTVRTADRYIDSHMVFGGAKLDTVSNLDQSAMYLLAADNAPEAALEEAQKLAGKGEQITQKKAKEIIAKHSPTKARRKKNGSIKSPDGKANKAQKSEAAKLLGAAKRYGDSMRTAGVSITTVAKFQKKCDDAYEVL